MGVYPCGYGVQPATETGCYPPAAILSFRQQCRLSVCSSDADPVTAAAGESGGLRGGRLVDFTGYRPALALWFTRITGARESAAAGQLLCQADADCRRLRRR